MAIMKTSKRIKVWLISALVAICTLLFYFLLYMPFRETFLVEGLFVFFALVIFPVGIYLLLTKRVYLKKESKEIMPFVVIYLVFVIFDIIITASAAIKIGLTRDINIALSFLHGLFGMPALPITFIIGYFMAFAFALPGIAFTYWILNKNAKYFWITIFIVWAASGIRLILSIF